LTQELSTAGLLRGKDPSKVAELVSFTADLQEAVKDAVYVQECIPEVLQMKKDMFAKVRRIIYIPSPDIHMPYSTKCVQAHIQSSWICLGFSKTRISKPPKQYKRRRFATIPIYATSKIWAPKDLLKPLAAVGSQTESFWRTNATMLLRRA
jgi:hypothetical protein